MYKVYAKNGDETLCIHNDVSTSKDDKLSSPKLTLTENTAGQFDAKVPSTNVGYDHLERVYTEIIVERQGTEIWSGRIISIKEDFYKNKTITCEGAMAYLNDTIQPQEPYEDTDTNNVLDALLQIHNQKVDERKQITLGYTTINGSISSSYTNYNSTLEAINDLVIKPFGGIIEVKRNNNGQLKLNYFSEDDRSPSSQTINFGENLLDFTKSYDSTDFCTVVLPLGARIQDKYGISASGIEGVEAYVTIEEVNDGSPYLANLDTVETYGRIEKTIQYSEIEDPEELKDAATLYLTAQQFDKMVIEINAVDLGYLNVNAGNINLSENVRVISRPHGLDRFFPVTKISIPLDNPANTTFTMGGTVTSLTTKGVSGIGGLSDLIEKIPTKSDILDAAKRRADDLINAFTTGYITITTDENGSNELFVTDTKITTKQDVFNHSNRYWRWNLNGLGYYNKNKAKYSNPNGLVMAMTMDGEICADFITTGVLTAEVIKTGILQGVRNQDNWWNLDTGELHVKMGSVDGLSHQFELTEEGLMEVIEDTENGLRNEISQTASGLRQRISNAEGDINNLEITASGLSSSISNAQGDISRLQQTANGLSTSISNAQGDISSLQQTANSLSISIGNKVNTSDLPTLMEANANSIRLQSSNIVVKSTNFNVDASGNMSCSNAKIKGTIEVGGDNNSYGSIIIRDGSNNVSFYINNEGIGTGDYRFGLTKDGIGFSGSGYAGMNSDGTVQLDELDIRDSRGVYVFNGDDYRRGLTGTIQVYTYVGHGNTRRQRYLHFKNGILYAIDETYNDGFTPLIDN